MPFECFIWFIVLLFFGNLDHTHSMLFLRFCCFGNARFWVNKNADFFLKTISLLCLATFSRVNNTKHVKTGKNISSGVQTYQTQQLHAMLYHKDLPSPVLLSITWEVGEHLICYCQTEDARTDGRTCRWIVCKHLFEQN